MWLDVPVNDVQMMEVHETHGGLAQDGQGVQFRVHIFPFHEILQCCDTVLQRNISVKINKKFQFLSGQI